MKPLNFFQNGFYANIYAQVVGILTQIAIVPVFISSWGLHNYGVWIMISSIQAYVSYGDMGISVACMNSVCEKFSGGKIEGAKSEYYVAIINVFVNSFVIFIITILVGYLLFFFGFDGDIILAGVFLSFQAIFSLNSTIFDTYFRVNNKYYKGVYVTESIRLFEWLASGLAAYLGGGIVNSAFYLFLTRAILVFLVYIWIYFFDFSLIKPKLIFEEWNNVGRHRKNGFGWLQTRLSDSIGLQAVSFLFGVIASPSVAALYNTHRTISRIAVQFANSVTNSYWSSFSEYFGRREKNNFLNLLNETRKRVSLVYCSCCVFVLIIGPFFMSEWTRGKVGFDFHIMLLMLFGAYFTSIHYNLRIVLASVGRVYKYSFASLVYSIFSLVFFAAAIKISFDLSIALVAINEVILFSIVSFYVKKEVLDAKF